MDSTRAKYRLYDEKDNTLGFISPRKPMYKTSRARSARASYFGNRCIDVPSAQREGVISVSKVK